MLRGPPKMTIWQTIRDRLSQPAAFDDYDLSFVPSEDPNYCEDPDLLQAVGIGAADDLPTLVVGPAGAGKNSLLAHVAARSGAPLRRISMKSDMRSAHFLGEKIVDLDRGTRNSVVLWRDGVLAEAARRGHWIVIDEVDACPAGILLALQSVLEQGHPLCLAENHGEVVPIHPNFRIFATANTLGHGDDSGLYAGTHVLNEATLDRFAITIQQGYLPIAKEAAVVSAKTGIDLDIAGEFVDIATLVRQDGLRGKCTCTFSTRRLIAWGQLAVRIGGKSDPSNDAIGQAYRLAVGNKLSDLDAAYVAGVVQRTLAISGLAQRRQW